MQDCTFWAFDSFSDFANGALLLMDENNASESFLSFSYGMHKLPLAWFKCALIREDYAMLAKLTTELAKGLDEYGPIVTTFFWNFTFNWVDIIYEALALGKAYGKRNWYLIGTFVAKIFADLIFKNPENINWNYKNSDVMNSEWGAAPSFWQGVDELFSYLGWGDVLSTEEREASGKPESAGDIFTFEDEEEEDTGPDYVFNTGGESESGGQTISVGSA